MIDIQISPLYAQFAQIHTPKLHIAGPRTAFRCKQSKTDLLGIDHKKVHCSKYLVHFQSPEGVGRRSLCLTSAWWVLESQWSHVKSEIVPMDTSDFQDLPHLVSFTTQESSNIGKIGHQSFRAVTSHSDAAESDESFFVPVRALLQRKDYTKCYADSDYVYRSRNFCALQRMRSRTRSGSINVS